MFKLVYYQVYDKSNIDLGLVIYLISLIVRLDILKLWNTQERYVKIDEGNLGISHILLPLFENTFGLFVSCAYVACECCVQAYKLGGCYSGLC